MKVTPWFPASVKPVRVGWYDCFYAGTSEPICRRYWNGSSWKIRGDNGCLFGYGVKGLRDKWRGLAEKPE